MKVFITAGTFDYIKKFEAGHPDELILTMVNENGALSYHETAGQTIFKEPRRYEILEAIGGLTKQGFAVMNNIPVTDDGRPLFEYQFKNRMSRLEGLAGFKAFRLLRPLSSNTYVIMTIWSEEAAYDNWKSSDAFPLAHKSKNLLGIQQPKIFESAPYVSKYSISDSITE